MRLIRHGESDWTSSRLDPGSTSLAEWRVAQAAWRCGSMISRMYLMETRMMNDPEFDRLLAEAVAAPFFGWDFSWIEGRRVEEEDTVTTWDYEERARKLVQSADSILDLGTQQWRIYRG